MGDIVLTEHQQLCRTAHQQVAMLCDLYDHLLLDEQSGADIPGFSATARKHELQRASELLSAKLDALDLLPAPPDPEWEGVLEAFSRLKSAFTSGGDAAFAERLGDAEDELLRLIESLAQHDCDPALDEAIERTRVACRRLTAAASAAD